MNKPAEQDDAVCFLNLPHQSCLSLAHKNLLPGSPVSVVLTLRTAGAVIFTKTNGPQALLAFECANPLWGYTCNPWSSAHTAGGSSCAARGGRRRLGCWGVYYSLAFGSFRVVCTCTTMLMHVCLLCTHTWEYSDQLAGSHSEALLVVE